MIDGPGEAALAHWLGAEPPPDPPEDGARKPQAEKTRRNVGNRRRGGHTLDTPAETEHENEVENDIDPVEP